MQKNKYDFIDDYSDRIVKSKDFVECPYCLLKDECEDVVHPILVSHSKKGKTIAYGMSLYCYDLERYERALKDKYNL